MSEPAYVTPAHHRAQHNAYQRTRYRERRRRGLCVTCGAPVADGGQCCRVCRRYKATCARAAYRRHKETHP